MRRPMAPNAPRPMKIAVLGCGGIGGTIAIHLAKAPVELTIVTTNEAVRNVWQTTGPFFGDRAVGCIVPRERVIARIADAEDVFDLVFIAVQPPEVESVAREAASRLAADGRIVCLPNGLCEELVARFVGTERVVGAVVAWGARMTAPGHYLRTSKGGFRLGTLEDRADPKLPPIAELLSLVGPVEETRNLRGARFSKLALNCAVSTLGTIGGTTLGELLVEADARRLALCILREAVAVADAEGIPLELVTHLNLALLRDRGTTRSVAREFVEHGLLLAVGLRYRRMRSSMLAQLERGRAPSVDFLNGEIVRRGEALGVDVSANRAVRDLVWAIARKETTTGMAAVRFALEEARRHRVPPGPSSRT